MTGPLASPARPLALALCLAVGLGSGGARAEDAIPEAPSAPEAPAPDPAEVRFSEDFSALTRAPHRLTGSEPGRRAASHIEARLRQMGLEPLPLEMPVFSYQTVRCELRSDGHVVRLYPLRANLTVPPTTAPEGVTAPLMYVGHGSPSDYRGRSPEGKLVVLDGDSLDAWERAFAWGAKGVIFLEAEGPPDPAPKHVDLPVNELRVFAPREVLDVIDLRQDRDRVTLVSEVVWRPSQGTNLVAKIAGSDPTFTGEREEPEAIVLASAYDSFGVVPERSRGTRAAGNVAGLLEAGRTLLAHRPKRDVWLAFLDDQAHAHQGARELYDAWLMSDETSREQAKEHQAERRELSAVLRLLQAEGLGAASGASDARRGLHRVLSSEAEHARDEVQSELARTRLELRSSGQAALKARAQALDSRSLAWDEVRRALHHDALAELVRDHTEATGPFRELFGELEERARDRLKARLQELGQWSRIDAQRAALREAFRHGSEPSFIVLHAALELSAGGPSFGVAVGDFTNDLYPFRPARPDGDHPGYYGAVLSALSAAAGEEPRLPYLEPKTLADASFGRVYASQPFVSSSWVAGSYGVYGVTLLTGFDARPFDGHPEDAPEAVDLGRLRGFADQATELLRRAANSPDLSLPQVFKPSAVSRYPSYADGQSKGDYARLMVSGALKEDRPARGAMLASFPGATQAAQPWGTRAETATIPSFDASFLEVADERGRIRGIGLRDDLMSEIVVFGALFDEHGRVRAVSSQENHSQKLTDALRVNLFFGQGRAFVATRTHPTRPDQLKVLKASSDSEFRKNRIAWGQIGQHGFFYISDQIVDYRVKLFQPMGLALLGGFSPEAPFGNGVDPRQIVPGFSLAAESARDLHALNERRLGQLRRGGVTQADLELYHARAERALKRSGHSSGVAERQGALLRSAALSHRVYQPLRAAMDDLVHAIVLLLLLAIPFAFSMERLTFCAATVYGRIGGFAFWFLLTFGLLYGIHPGFAIASTPAIVFLAFAIVLLSSMVIYITVRKFKTELLAMQGLGAQDHAAEVSRAGTLLAAVGMGMSTMRRRPTRTTLTAITVVMLTFTILSFASFTRTLGVRAIYEGAVGEQVGAGLLLRRLDYAPIPAGTLDMLQGREGEHGLIAPEYWLTQKPDQPGSFSVTREEGGEALSIDALMGLLPAELERAPRLAAALGSGSLEAKQRSLLKGEVYLPPAVAQVLGVGPGDRVRVNGHGLLVSGILDAGALQRLRHLDGQSVLPVDFKSQAAAMAGASPQGQGTENELIVQEADREFTHLASDQVIVGSAELVHRLGGEIHALGIYPGTGVSAPDLGRRLAELVVMPVWAAGADGVERLIFTVLTDVSGGLSLLVPLLLGGLIVFGTLLGSISDRQREIYTFSALGLSPGHVGALFFAEAAVYAVVGGMGGQLLAQLVGLGATRLSRAGVIEATNLNYSSTNSLFAIGVVMLTVLASAVYPAVRASRSANPGLARSWKMPRPEGDRLDLTFPFTVSAYDITGVVSYLAEHFRRHDDAGLGDFAASDVAIGRDSEGRLKLSARLALPPFDLGVTEILSLTAVASDIVGIDEVRIGIVRESGAHSDWIRQNRTFLQRLRRQFLIFRTLGGAHVDRYRLRTLELLAERGEEAPA